jgi:hypothetical protein
LAEKLNASCCADRKQREEFHREHDRRTVNFQSIRYQADGQLDKETRTIARMPSSITGSARFPVV